MFIILTPILEGCVYHQEINELGIVSAIGIQKNNSNYLTTVSLINTQKNTEDSKITTISYEGKTVFESIRNMTNISSRKLYLPHTRILIISKEIVNDNIKPVIDFLARDAESMINFYVLISDDPKKILESLTPLEDIPSEYISNMLINNSENLGTTYSFTYEDFLSDYVTPGINPSFSFITLEENKTTTSILKEADFNSFKLDNIYVYDENKKLIKLSKMESISYNILRNKLKESVITLNCDDNNYKYSSLITDSSTEFNYKNNIFYITSNIKINVSDYSCKSLLSKEEVIEKIEKNVSKYIKKNIINLLNKSKFYKNDFIGFGKYLSSNNKKYFNKYKNNWDTKGLETLNFKVLVNVKSERKDNILDNIKKGD